MQQFAVTFNDADSVLIDRARNTRPDRITLRQVPRASPPLILYASCDGVEKREEEREERSNARRLIDHATAYRPFVAHLPRERRRYALLGTLPTASDKDPCAGYGRTRWLDTRASLWYLAILNPF